MPALKIALKLTDLRQPLDAALRFAAEERIAAVELDGRSELNLQSLSQTGLRQLRKRLEDYQLKVSAVGFRTRRGYGVAEDLERRVDATKAAMRFAHALGANLLVNQVGYVSDEESPERSLMLEVLADLGRFGQRVGTLLAAETGSESGADLRRLIDALPPGSIGVALSPGNLIVHGFSPLGVVEALGSDILYVYANDGIHDRASGRGSEVQLGRGSVDFPALLGALEERGYRGYFCIERQRSDEARAEIAQAIEYLRAL